VFSALLADMLGAVAWPPNPWARRAAPAAGGAGAPGGPGGPASPAAAARSSALRPGGSPGARVHAAAADIATVALAAHPFRQLYLSGARPVPGPRAPFSRLHARAPRA